MWVQAPSRAPISSERSSVFRAHLTVCQHLGTVRSQVDLRFAKRTFCFGETTNNSGSSSCRSDHFKLLPWSNTTGIRLLSGTMQVRTLPAAPLPGSVKVARRFVKPFGVGASPTLAANFQGVMSAADGLVRNEEVAGATPATLTIPGRRADISSPSARTCTPVSKTGSASPRSERYRRLPPLSCSSKTEHSPDKRENAEHYRAGQPIYGRRTSPPE
jgi:hypothetical protein